MKTASVIIKDGVVVKTGVPELMRIEADKTARACEIAGNCGLFEVPKVLDYDHSTGRVTFELIRDIRPMRQVVNAENMACLMNTTGRILTIIHRHLTLPKDMIIPLPQQYRLENTDVFLHGDFALCNIYLNTDSNRIVVIDWQVQSRKLNVNATYGTRYFDIMWFVYNLFYRPVRRKRYRMAVAAEPMAREFLNGYFATSDFAYNGPELKGYMKHFLEVKIAERRSWLHWKRRLLLMPCHMKLRKLIKAYDFDKTELNESGKKL